MRRRRNDQSEGTKRGPPFWVPVDEDDRDQLPDERGLENSIKPPPIPQTFAEISTPSRLHLVLSLHLYQVVDWLLHQLRHEQAQRGGFLWVPVLLGSGCVLYFQLPREPWPYAFPVAAIALLLLAWHVRGTLAPALPTLISGVAIVAVGISLAQWRTLMLDTKLFDRSLIANVSGQVARTELRADGRVRYTLKVMSLSEGEVTPQKVRLTARQSDRMFNIGDVIEGNARLGPPPGPAMPGGYDFRFFAWYAGIGGSGYFLGHPKLIEGARPPPMHLMMHVDALRHRVGQILREALPGQASALATALIIGERSGIDEATNQALRRSGLAHILAISGLHMALVSLTVISSIRLICALQMDLVARYPIKKWAGGLGLICATVYLFLSGASLSTQRAYIMVAIMLLAVLLDRRALTMRNVALAALVVLLFTPEAVLHPGFQMSFAAVAALVGTYEVLSNRAANRLAGMAITPWSLFRLRARNYLFGLAMVPLIAGMATGLFAAFHFYRIAPLGLLANMLAMPVVSVAVMPLALMSVMLMPFGLEQLALVPMGQALQIVVAVATWVADLSPLGSTGAISPTVLVFGSLALMTATLCRSRLKLLALPCIAVMWVGLMDRPRPDVIISENGRQIGLFIDGSALVLSKPKAEKFTTRLWREAYLAADLADGSLATSPSPRHCDRFGCVLQKPGLVVAHVQNTARLSQDCLQADVLVMLYEMPWACSFLAASQRPLVIDGAALRGGGAHAITISVATDGHRELHVQTARKPYRRVWQRIL